MSLLSMAHRPPGTLDVDFTWRFVGMRNELHLDRPDQMEFFTELVTELVTSDEAGGVDVSAESAFDTQQISSCPRPCHLDVFIRPAEVASIGLSSKRNDAS